MYIGFMRFDKLVYFVKIVLDKMIYKVKLSIVCVIFVIIILFLFSNRCGR